MSDLQIEKIQWFHRITLNDGRVTQGIVDIAQHETRYLFDRLDFTGKSVLDIGCWDGYFSFMAEQRGASRVLSLDDPEFRWGGMDGYNFLHQHFQSQAEWRKGSVYALPDERFDIVLCYGVLYHLGDPLTAMINCFHASLSEVLFEGLIYQSKNPTLFLFAPKEFHNDPTNVYSLSTAYLEKVATICGFELVETKMPRYAATPLRRFFRRVKPGYDRATMRFRRVKETTPGYAASCFLLAPKALTS
ncbi:MAG: methyltransferase domain-containing protein [Methylococcales bacterium]|nr:methyltransferase domain-containing protein [Methylococcales bacterium]